MVMYSLDSSFITKTFFYLRGWLLYKPILLDIVVYIRVEYDLHDLSIDLIYCHTKQKYAQGFSKMTLYKKMF